MRITSEQAVAYRLLANHLIDRLPRGAYAEAAYAGLQDTAPRDALLALHARVTDCAPAAWEDPALIQTYSPRAAVHVLPAKDFGVFTVGRLPCDDAAAKHLDDVATAICRALGGHEVRATELAGRYRTEPPRPRGRELDELRPACATGRIALRWTTSALWVHEVPRPDLDRTEARRELLHRHLRRFAPTTPQAFAWWAGLSAPDARSTWALLADELVEVDLDGTRAWIHQADEPAFSGVPEPHGVRLLVEPDLRLLGRDRSGLFAGPGKRPLTPATDTFHPNGVLVDGRIVGAWGRKGGRVSVKLSEPLTAAQRDAVSAEATSFPIPGAGEISVAITEWTG
ncbi:DNA glycosylase AlkZ-like family protein [Kribbella sp. DT2]|uniref:DNA glycosylase AlkZ-like family protein n=1 Tax=Kribbella sp. DT2 TaxID=3393427 RepID=UPI003CF5C7A8